MNTLSRGMVARTCVRWVLLVCCGVLSLVVVTLLVEDINYLLGKDEAGGKVVRSCRPVGTKTSNSPPCRQVTRAQSPPFLEDPKTHTGVVEDLLGDPRFNGVRPDLPELISYIRRHKMDPPASGPYTLEEPELEDFSEFGQSKMLDRVMLAMQGGLFVEAGASDGETASNTLFAERVRGWRGLLVEPDPGFYHQLLTKGRRSHSVNTCLSLTTTPETHYFSSGIFGGRITNDKEGLEIQCLPLYSLLLALNTTTIHYLSLDVEGDELKVLMTIPWNKVKILLLTVETFLVEEGEVAVKAFLTTKGYRAFRYEGEMFFVHKKMITQYYTKMRKGERVVFD